MIYLDNAATTYPKPECVYEALDYANRNQAFNAGRGAYKEARNVSNMIDDTRDKVGALVGVSGNTVSFESSATEAMNIIINGLELHKGDTVYITPFEHNAVVRPLYNLKNTIGIEIEILPFVRDTWEFDIKKANDMFVIKKPKACFVTHISNVTGYILPTGVIFALSKQYNCINILDCSQSLGVLNPSAKDVDLIVFAGHKSLYASFGIAGFINISNVLLKITKSGGTGSDSLNVAMPDAGYSRYEAGSLNSVVLAGLNSSIDWLNDNSILVHENILTKYLVDKLVKIPNVKLFMPNSENVVGIISIGINGYKSDDVGSILYDEFGICVRTGYHCSPFVHQFIGSKDYGGTIRISLGFFNSIEDIDELIKALETFI